jgi:cytochrome c553
MRNARVRAGWRSRIAAAAVGCTAVAAAVPAPAYAASPAAGARWFPLCASCHGDRAEGDPQLHAPRLQGLSAAYLLRQLRDFRSGRRGSSPADDLGQEMKSMAAVLPNDRAAHDVVAYITGLRPSVETASKGDLSAAAAYQTCAGCHGRAGDGDSAVGAPALSGQNVDYLRRQLRAFRLGWRGAAPGDPPGRQMAAVARSLPEQTLSQAIALLGTPSRPAATGKHR